jgi:hypothetical protein
MWGYVFTTKAATQQGGSAGYLPSFYVVGLISPVVARARVWFTSFTRAEEFAERQLSAKAPIAQCSKSMSTARGTYLPPEAS